MTATAVAEATGLNVNNAGLALRYLADEYGAVQILPLTKAVRLVERGLEMYEDGPQNRAHSALWP